MLSQFDEAIHTCRTVDARVQIGEAVKCYETGAYRSAIVMAYVAVCYDLIDKLRALEATGDGKAKKLLADLSKYQEQIVSGNDQALGSLLKFERELIEKFRDDFEFFGVNEYDEMVRLRSDRNRCAHPTFFKSERPYKPSAELARLHIRNSIAYVLSQEPKQGKAAIDQFENAILSTYFPETIEEAEERFRALGLHIAREPLVRALADNLVFNTADKAHPYHTKPSAFNAIDAIIEMRKPIAAPRVAENVTKILKTGVDEAVEAASIICIRNSDVRSYLPQEARGFVTSWIEKTEFSAPAEMVQRALDVDWMREAALARLKELPASAFKYIEAPVEDVILDRVAELYCEARQWDTANELADVVAIPFANSFGEKQLRHIFDEATNGKADLRGSHGFSSFVKKVYEESDLEKELLDELTEEFDLKKYRPD